MNLCIESEQLEIFESENFQNMIVFKSLTFLEKSQLFVRNFVNSTEILIFSSRSLIFLLGKINSFQDYHFL